MFLYPRFVIIIGSSLQTLLLIIILINFIILLVNAQSSATIKHSLPCGIHNSPETQPTWQIQLDSSSSSSLLYNKSTPCPELQISNKHVDSIHLNFHEFGATKIVLRNITAKNIRINMGTYYRSLINNDNGTESSSSALSSDDSASSATTSIFIENVRAEDNNDAMTTSDSSSSSLGIELGGISSCRSLIIKNSIINTSRPSSSQTAHAGVHMSKDSKQTNKQTSS